MGNHHRDANNIQVMIKMMIEYSTIVLIYKNRILSTDHPNIATHDVVLRKPTGHFRHSESQH